MTRTLDEKALEKAADALETVTPLDAYTVEQISDGMHEAIRTYLDACDGYQSRVDKWMTACFGPAISSDRIERNHRFLEEALELVQANGCTQSEAHQLVDYVFGRPVGEIGQEVGGVMVTLTALCSASALNLEICAETELARVWTKVETIRAKQAAKPKHSPLPKYIGNARDGWRPLPVPPAEPKDAVK